MSHHLATIFLSSIVYVVVTVATTAALWWHGIWMRDDTQSSEHLQTRAIEIALTAAVSFEIVASVLLQMFLVPAVILAACFYE